jgi:hypothetical protein
MLQSDFVKLCPVIFPQFGNRQRYMWTLDATKPIMPEKYEDYLKAVESLLDAAGVHAGVVHMTVDEKVVQAGMSQRRPKPHVDGCFIPTAGRWGGGGGWLHTCNNLGLDYPLKRMHIIVAASVPCC